MAARASKPAGRRPRYRQADVRAALLACGGIYTQAAELLGCDRGTVANYVGRYPQLADIRFEASEILLDYAESAIFEAVKAGKSWAVRFVLDRKGGSRGWRPSPNRIEHDHAEQRILLTIVGGLPDGPDFLPDGPGGNVAPIESRDIGKPGDIIEAAAREIFG